MKRSAWIWTLPMVGTAAVMFVASTLVAHDADAFYVATRALADGGGLSPPKYDTGMPVEYRIAMDGLPVGDGSEVAAIEAAFSTVDAIPCSTLAFTEGVRVPMAMIDPRHWEASADRYILVYWSGDPAIWGTTRSVGRFDFAHDGAGNMIGATIVLNSGDHVWSTTGEADKLDVQGTLTALIVRSLGLTSTMMGNASYPVYTPGDTSKRTLGSDDIAGVTYLYGDGSAGCGDTMPEGMCAMGDPMCPPTPVVDAGMGTRPDGGVVPRTDAGGGGGSDGGTTGTPPADDGGCSCRVAGAGARASSGAGAGGPGALGLGALGLGGLVVARRRRRRSAAPRAR